MTQSELNPDVVENGTAEQCPVDHTAAQAPATIPSSQVPGPTDPQPDQERRYILQRTQFLEECRERYGSRFRLGIKPGMDFFVLTDPEDVRAVYTAPRTSLHCGKSNGVLEKYFGGTGIAFLDEDEHRARRKALTRSFKGAAFKRIQEGVERITEESVAQWPRDEAVDMHPLVHRWAMTVIREVVFGKVVPACWDKLLDELMQLVEFNRYPLSMALIDSWPEEQKEEMKQDPSNGLAHFWLHRPLVDELIAEAIEERVTLGELGDDMLSVMLTMTNPDGSEMSGKELRDEIMTMFVAGTVTTVSAVCWSLEHFTRDPERLAVLRAEVDAGATDEYRTAAVHEVLRINPPLPNNLARLVVAPIEIGGVRYEPGQMLVPSAELMNNDPRRYPEPDTFNPERFLGVQPGQYSWIPFGGGHTRCMGDQIAIHEIKTMVGVLARDFDLERTDPAPAEPGPRGPVVVPRTGPTLTLRARVTVPATA